MTDDLVMGSGVCVLFHHRQVAIFTVGKPPVVHAIANHDPFSKANVLSRGIIGSLQGRPVVASPIFKQHFCLQSGRCIEDDSVAVEVYPARIAGNHVQLKPDH
jgi:nitrite reductase (NADH) small subunit